MELNLNLSKEQRDSLLIIYYMIDRSLNPKVLALLEQSGYITRNQNGGGWRCSGRGREAVRSFKHGM